MFILNTVCDDIERLNAAEALMLRVDSTKSPV
jgi:hypothetical protein